MTSHSKFHSLKQSHRGFTIVELMVGVGILGIITVLAIPSLSDFLVRMRVDNEISQIHRVILTARNEAINKGINITVCPLNAANTCTANWQNEISVFIDLDGDNIYEPSPGNVTDETLLKVKNAIAAGDQLTWSGGNPIIYAPTGGITGAGGLFSYCPSNEDDMARGVIIAATGRLYQTSDIDSDNKDEDRNGNEINCP